jgi:regulator of cell morphogenesis and NO signaling
MRLGDIVARYPQTRALMEQFGLDYCCGGKHTLAEAAGQVDKDPQEITARLNEALETTEQDPQTNFPAMSSTELADYIESTHHSFMHEQLPRLSALITKVQGAHSQRHGAMLTSLRQVYEQLKAEIEMHLEKEEQILFPYIRQIETFAKGLGEVPQVHCGSVQNPINQMEYEHDVAGGALAKMRELTDDYAVPDDGCESFKALYEGLAALEQDLHQHIHLENNILFPKAIALERTMMHKQDV